VILWGLFESAMPRIQDWRSSLLPEPVVPPTRACGPVGAQSRGRAVPTAVLPTRARRLPARDRPVRASGARGP
jgi:hypothetical protein